MRSVLEVVTLKSVKPQEGSHNSQVQWRYQDSCGSFVFTACVYLVGFPSIWEGTTVKREKVLRTGDTMLIKAMHSLYFQNYWSLVISLVMTFGFLLSLSRNIRWQLYKECWCISRFRWWLMTWLFFIITQIFFFFSVLFFWCMWSSGFTYFNVNFNEDSL